ncbi:MAG: LysR substrate-binding domain-containing protein [Kiloniellales bacterium]
MSLSLRHVRYFIAAAETGQVSQAAVDLNVSQSAVTAAIKGLERTLETRLFDRRSTGVSLTYEGHQFLQHARNIVAAVDQAARAPRQARKNASGTIRVGVTYTVAGYFLRPHLARFSRVFPDIQVQLHEAPRREIEQAIKGGDLDIAVLLVSNLESREALASEILIRSRRRLWLPTDHRLLTAGPVSIEDVAREPYVMLTVDEASQTALRYWEKTAFRPREIFRTSSVEAVRSMVATGMGVTILSDMVYRPWSLDGQRIETRGLTDPVPTMDVGLAWKRSATLTAAAQAFYDYFSLTFNGAGQGLLEPRAAR